MIQIKNVTKLYPAKESGNGGGKDNASIHALDHISLHVTAGEWLSIMGPSGSGKSTLVNLIGCLDRPSSGEIWLDLQNVAGIPSAELDRVRATFCRSRQISPELGRSRQPIRFTSVDRSEEHTTELQS